MPIDNPELRSFINKEIKGETKLSSNIPLPNIVRIEALGIVDRNRYLGTIQQTVNDVKGGLRNKLTTKNLDKFYGFTKGVASKKITLNSVWQPFKGSGGVVDVIRSVVAGGSSGLGGSQLGDFPELLRDITGINVSSTGATTLNRFQSTTLGDFNVSCGWYLPEQFNLCIKSLRSIIALTYPVQVSNITASQLGEAVISTTKKVIGLGDPANGANPQVPGSEATTPKKIPNLVVTPFGVIDTTDFAEIEAKRLANQAETSKEKEQSDARRTKNKAFELIADGLSGIFDLFGKNLTFDPFPVRCSIGQYIDIEPLIIEKLSMDFSNETFINSDGRHVPLFCSVDIHFKFWLTPAPKLQFMSLLGQEMFGETKGTT